MEERDKEPVLKAPALIKILGFQYGRCIAAWETTSPLALPEMSCSQPSGAKGQSE